MKRTFNEDDLIDESGCFTPCGPLWFDASQALYLLSVTHLLLCRPGLSQWGPDSCYGVMSNREGHITKEFQDWVALIRAVRPTLVDLVLEQRPVYDSAWIYGEDMSPPLSCILRTMGLLRRQVVLQASLENDLRRCYSLAETQAFGLARN